MSLTLPIEHIRALGWKDKQKVEVVLANPPFIRLPASSLKSQAAVPLVVLQRADVQASADIAMPSGTVLVALVVVATPGQVKERGMETRAAPVTFRSPATVRVCDGEVVPIPTFPLVLTVTKGLVTLDVAITND